MALWLAVWGSEGNRFRSSLFYACICPVFDRSGQYRFILLFVDSAGKFHCTCVKIVDYCVVGDDQFVWAVVSSVQKILGMEDADLSENKSSIPQGLCL